MTMFVHYESQEENINRFFKEALSNTNHNENQFLKYFTSIGSYLQKSYERNLRAIQKCNLDHQA